VVGAVAHIVDVVTAFAVLVGRRATDVDARILFAGLAFQLTSDTVRNRGWCNIVRATYPRRPQLRMRDLLVAYFGGAGLGAVAPARGGDLVKLALLRRRVPGSRLSTLAATLFPETLFECVMGAALVAWALRSGGLPTEPILRQLPGLVHHLVVFALLAAGVVAALACLTVVVGRRARRLYERVRDGLVVLGRPAWFMAHVASWQALGRLIRLAAVACYMAAFGLTVSFTLVLLVMAIDGGARVRLGPVATAVRGTLYAYALPRASGGTITSAEAVGYMLAMNVFSTVSGLSISAAVLGTLGATAARRRAGTLIAGASPAAARAALARLLRGGEVAEGGVE
jgi:hypothetical protein